MWDVVGLFQSALVQGEYGVGDWWDTLVCTCSQSRTPRFGWSASVYGSLCRVADQCDLAKMQGDVCCVQWCGGCQNLSDALRRFQWTEPWIRVSRRVYIEENKPFALHLIFSWVMHHYLSIRHICLLNSTSFPSSSKHLVQLKTSVSRMPWRKTHIGISIQYPHQFFPSKSRLPMMLPNDAAQIRFPYCWS